ncbi:MAG TPA: PepSY domain-containing protein [Vicinamibacterales bacterium]|jgi:hypothetical protein
MTFDWRRAVVFMHRWLGIAGCTLFVAWFASGIVMMYARMPELSPTERQARLPPLDLAHATSGLARLVRESGRDAPDRIVVGMLFGRPVYRLISGRQTSVVFADDGARLEPLTPEQALVAAREFAPEHAATVRYDGRLAEPDQWAFEHLAALPMHRVALGDADDSSVYVSERTGEIVIETTASSRRLAYAGAILHWLYWTPFRRHGVVWTQSIIWLSGAGVVTCLLGLVWGVYTGLKSPYRGWMRWHHGVGLVFGGVSLAWVFSGLLSMDPWGLSSDGAPTSAQRVAFAGDRVRALNDLDARWDDVRRHAPRDSTIVKEIEITWFRGAPQFSVNGRPMRAVDRDDLMAVARAAMPDAAVTDAAWLDDYDSYYYDRQRRAALPVMRVRYDDPARTWLYIDAQRGTVLRKEDRVSRVDRWLYHGLHSWDFPFLYRRRPLWDILLILLSLGGISSAVTALVPAWRRLRRHARRLYS